MSQPLRLLTYLFAVTLCWLPAQAHEYWLMPKAFSPPVGEPAGVQHRLGQQFKGNELPWVTVWNVRSELWVDGQKNELRSKDGDRPALTVTPADEGMLVLVHESNIDRLDFKTWEKFEAYTTKEGLTAIAEQHLAEGQPKPSEEEPLRELYARFAKTLLTPGGSTQGRDVVTGLTIELVALEHPLALEQGAPMPVQLLFNGKPLAGATVTVFPEPGKDFKHKILTDEQGRAMIPDEGPGPYLLNAIAMTKVTATGPVAEGADWQSFWASLTYSRGG